MKCECSIVQDLLPLYEEGMLRDETAAFVRGHLADCAACRQAQAGMTASAAAVETISAAEDTAAAAEAAPLRRLKRMLLRRQLQTVAFLALFGAALLVAAWAALDAPRFLSCEEAEAQATRQPDGSVTISFGEQAMDCRIHRSQAPEDTLALYFVEAWTSRWQERFGGEAQLLTAGGDGETFAVFYVNNDGTDDTLLYSSAALPFAGVQTLPRLALGYYLMVALALLAALSVAWLLCRGRTRRWLGRCWLLPASYLAGHVAVCGFRTITYTMERQLPLILLTTLLIYAGALLAAEVLRLTREIRRCRP